MKEISNKIDDEVLILFWQFTIRTLGELDIVSNQHLSIEMFLMRLIHLNGFVPTKDIKDDELKKNGIKSDKNFSPSNIQNKETVNQIKSVTQEKKIKPQSQMEPKITNEIIIESFNELLQICKIKKEIKLKYQLEKNVNLVKFENGRIEISFNDNLDKDFVKELSAKLLEWTNQRWIISFSKSEGNISIRDKEIVLQKRLIENAKKSDFYKSVLKYFSDAELIDVKSTKKDDE